MHFSAHALPNKAELVAEAMTKAIQLEKVVNFKYKKRGHEAQNRTFSPFMVDDEMGTVIGWDHDRDELRQFTLTKCAWPVEQTDDEEYVRPREKGDV